MTSGFDICIRGSGIVGHTLALLLARERLRVALVSTTAPEASASDVRAYALNARSRALLESVRCWPDAPHVTSVSRMEVCGDDQGLVLFDAQAIGVDALTWIVDVSALEARLREAVRFAPLIETLEAAPAATLTVICEGQDSATRQALGIGYAQHRYDQRAIAARLRSEHTHAQVARQWFSQGNILALLPIGGDAAQELALVWSLHNSRCSALMSLPDDAFVQEVEQACSLALGKLELTSTRHTWPLRSALAERWCGRSTPDAQHGAITWVLAGDAAHCVHPLAGQGLNLGLADAGELAEILHTRPDWRGLDDLRVLRRYERSRRSAVHAANAMLDGLQQLFAQKHSLWQRVRNLGMQGFDRSTWLKNWVARQAMGV